VAVLRLLKDSDDADHHKGISHAADGGARYHRVPGEPYGRGPILLALPTIKTLNKAVELTLKAAAIQMLGIWGYRPGGSFNPDTVRLGPGEIWPMQRPAACSARRVAARCRQRPHRRRRS
jgi:hypothetical protein